MNWFGRSHEVVATAPTTTQPLVPQRGGVVVIDNRVLVQEVTGLEVARTNSGAILRATGIASTQGYFNAQLVLESFDNGVATYGFRVEAPARPQPQGSAASRQITVAIDIAADELSAMRSIVVRGATNARTSGR